MKLNENTALIGQQIVLVPYQKHHVSTYHEWMKRPDLLEATASEPLTLEEEYEMQRKWREDEDKLTFIVLALPVVSESSSENASVDVDAGRGASSSKGMAIRAIRECKMIGDVNLFLPDGVQGDVECEVMIAEDEYRGRGIAGEALSMLLNYATKHLRIPPTYFLARISTTNTASIRLFEKLGFAQVKVVEAFGEVEMRFGRRKRERSESRRMGEEGEYRTKKVDGSEGEDEFQDFRVMEAEAVRGLVKDRWRSIGEEIAYGNDA